MAPGKLAQLRRIQKLPSFGRPPLAGPEDGAVEGAAAVRACRACGSTLPPVKVWDCPEMLRASGESFRYAECAACGSLWLEEPPADLAPYYGDSYYSFGAAWRGAPAWRR